jgi:hypothetical protein
MIPGSLDGMTRAEAWRNEDAIRRLVAIEREHNEGIGRDDKMLPRDDGELLRDGELPGRHGQGEADCHTDARRGKLRPLMNGLILAGVIAWAGTSGPTRSDEIASRVLDLEFTAALEAWVAKVGHEAIPARYTKLIDQLDADRYGDRVDASKQLHELCTADASGKRWLIRARAVERRPEARYWINRLLRQLNGCETCDGAGYCPEYRPAPPPADQPAYVGVPCQRCKRFEWQHGWQWIEGCRYGFLACEECGGSGTYWNHYAVD